MSIRLFLWSCLVVLSFLNPLSEPGVLVETFGPVKVESILSLDSLIKPTSAKKKSVANVVLLTATRADLKTREKLKTTFKQQIAVAAELQKAEQQKAAVLPPATVTSEKQPSPSANTTTSAPPASSTSSSAQSVASAPAASSVTPQASTQATTESASSVTTSASAPPATSASQTPPQAPTLVPNSIQIENQIIPLVDDQGAPAAPDGNRAGLWKGTGEVDDGQPTHIIGHNPGIFHVLFSLSVGSKVTVMDRNGHTREYTIYKILTVNDQAIGTDGQVHWDDILNQPGESISLQTCIDDNWNEMYLAH
ncbi:class F sortase [Enterococcus sp. CSURQ0835]|uniref:class F sortase n=1 Tax=Enterococcus sp. CSURQ0835 TaxID=2681394 RepID=UPI00135AC869|nr:class F sortase [Enterococcus sp. CSURQ0835]